MSRYQCDLISKVHPIKTVPQDLFFLPSLPTTRTRFLLYPSILKSNPFSFSFHSLDTLTFPSYYVKPSAHSCRTRRNICSKFYHNFWAAPMPKMRKGVQQGRSLLHAEYQTRSCWTTPLLSVPRILSSEADNCSSNNIQ